MNRAAAHSATGGPETQAPASLRRYVASSLLLHIHHSSFRSLARTQHSAFIIHHWAARPYVASSLPLRTHHSSLIIPHSARTLRRIVNALGGELELIANLPGGAIKLTQFKDDKRSA